MCGIRHLVVSQTIIRKVNDNDEMARGNDVSPALGRAVFGVRGS